MSQLREGVGGPSCTGVVLKKEWCISRIRTHLMFLHSCYHSFIYCRIMTDLWLKWNSQLELLGSLDNLLETESFVDVTIAVEGQLLKAHRVVLCASR